MKRRSFSKREISRFCGQLRMLLASGIPLLEALRIIGSLLRNRGIEALMERVSEGDSLGRSMGIDFPSLVASSVECAETAGNLEEVLGRLSKHYEERAEVEEKLKSALIYPAFVTVLCVLSLVVLFIFVLPGFKSLFLDLDADLPVLTQVILGAGEMVSEFWYVPFLTMMVSGALFFHYKRSERGSRAIDTLLLKLRFVSSGHVMHAFRTLGSLLQAGIPISAALATTASSSQNSAFERVMLEIKGSVENGERLSDIFSRYQMFPSAAVQMIRVGEGSGTLAEMLLNIAGFFEKEKEIFIKRFTSLLEPALTLTVGIMVGVIALAVFLPMINMISSLQ